MLPDGRGEMGREDADEFGRDGGLSIAMSSSLPTCLSARVCGPGPAMAFSLLGDFFELDRLLSAAARCIAASCDSASDGLSWRPSTSAIIRNGRAG